MEGGLDYWATDWTYYVDSLALFTFQYGGWTWLLSKKGELDYWVKRVDLTMLKGGFISFNF